MRAIESPSWERVLGGASTPQVRLSIADLDAPVYNPRPQIDTVISLHAKMKL